MYKTLSNNKKYLKNETKITVNSETLAELLDCGRATAIKIGTQAEARIQIGKRVLWNTNKVMRYLDSIATE